MIRIKEVKPLDDYKLLITFENNEKKIKDMKPYLEKGIFSKLKNKDFFNKVKIGFDVSMVTISLISCLLTLRRLGSVGVGTIIAAVLVGTVLGFVTRLFGVKRDAILYPKGRISK